MYGRIKGSRLGASWFTTKKGQTERAREKEEEHEGTCSSASMYSRVSILKQTWCTTSLMHAV